MKSNEFRILGQELGETDSFVDVTVNGIDGEGKLYFADTKTDREWELTNQEISRLMNQNLMVEAARVSQNSLWKLATTVDKKGIGNASDQFAVENIEDAQRSIFKAAYFENR